MRNKDFESEIKIYNPRVRVLAARDNVFEIKRRGKDFIFLPFPA